MSVMSILPFIADSTASGGFDLKWETTSSINEPVEYLSAEVMQIGDREFVYLVGGEANGISTTQVLFAEILPDGALSRWQSALEVSRNSGLSAHNTAVVGQQLYVLGGDEQVLCTSPLSDGSISSWKSTTPLRTDLTNFAVAVLEERIYIIGGWLNNGPTNIVYSGQTTPNCGPIQWEDEPPLPVSLSHAAAGIVADEFGKNFLVVVGGWIYPDTQQTIFTSTINGKILSPTLSDWRGEATIAEGVIFHSLAVTGGELFVIGGTPDDDKVSNLVYRFNIENESISDIITSELPLQIEKHDSVVRENGQVYVIGGFRETLSQTVANYQVITLYTPLGWIAKSNSPRGEVFAGDQITYTIHYTNNGLRPLTNLIITDEIPPNTILIRPEYKPDASVITRVVQTLDLNQSGSISFTVQVMPPLTAVPPALSTAMPTPTVQSINSGLTCSNGWSGGGGTPRPTCTPTTTPSPVATTPAPTLTPTPATTRIFSLTPIPVINQALMCEDSWCIQSNPVFNTPYHSYLPIVVR